MPGFVSMVSQTTKLEYICMPKQTLTAFPHTCYKYKSENRLAWKYCVCKNHMFLRKQYWQITVPLSRNASILLLGLKKNRTCLIFLSLIEHKYLGLHTRFLVLHHWAMKATTSLYVKADSPSHSMFATLEYRVWVLMKVSKCAKIRNRYNQVPHLTQDTNGKVTNSQ